MTHRLIKNGELCLYGPVGFLDWFSDEGFSATEVLAALTEMSGDIVVRINSGGGAAFDGVAIYNALNAHEGKVTCRVDGIAASAASVIAMAGDEIEMPEGSLMMIHDASGITIGNAATHAKTVDLLNKLDGELARIYAKRTGKEAAAIRKMMDAETWLDGDEAVEEGFATKASGDTADQPTAFAYQLYRHAPKGLAAVWAGYSGPHKAERTRLTSTGTDTAAAPSGENDMDLKSLTLSGLREQRPDLVAEIESGLTAKVDAAKAEGAKAERERVAGIRAALIPGHEKIIEAMIEDSTKTEIDAHRAVAAAERQTRADVRGSLDTDEAEMKGLRSEHGPANGKDEPKKPTATAQTPDGWKAEYAASEDLQGEFATEAAYLAFKQAEKAGRVRIKRAA